MSTLSFREQEKIEDYIQYKGSITNWDSEQGFHTLMTYLEQLDIGIRIEDHEPQWRVFLQDSEGDHIGTGLSFDKQPWKALALAVVQASFKDPIGYGQAFRQTGRASWR